MDTIIANAQKDMLEDLPVIAAFVQPDLKISWANRMCREFAGLSHKDTTGKSCFGIWGLAGQCSHCPVRRVIETGSSEEFTLPGPEQQSWPDTHGKWKIRLLPIRNEGGRVREILAIAYEVTPEYEVRQALRSSETRLRQAQKLASIGHWELDLQTGNLFWSEEIFNIFEIDPKRFGASYEAFLEATHPDDRERVNAAYKESLENKTSYKIEHRLMLPDGRIKHVQERCINYYDGQGKQVRSLGTVQDITARKTIEVENKRLQQQFLQAQKMESIGRLAGGVAHDFNNISSIIIGYSELAMDGVGPDDPLYEYLNQIYDAAKRSVDITSQLLAFARRQTIAPKLIDLNEALSGMIKMLGWLVGEDVALAFYPGESLWPVKIDPSQVDQIMANLCVNARDAIADVGKVMVETENACFDEEYCNSHLGFLPGEYVLLSVSDDGGGIPPEHMQNIFEPFFTTKGIGKGTGLGLATVYGIVKQNNGFINVYSEPGEGTVFKIYLPRHSGPTEHAHREQPAEIPPSRGETVLVVEDDPAILKLLETTLYKLGYSVLSAVDPEEAIREADGNPGIIDLLITDVVMPGMNGRVLSERLRHLYPRLKTLFISGYTANVIANRGILQDGVAFLSKPFSKKELANKIRDTLR